MNQARDDHGHQNQSQQLAASLGVPTPGAPPGKQQGRLGGHTSLFEGQPHRKINHNVASALKQAHQQPLPVTAAPGPHALGGAFTSLRHPPLGQTHVKISPADSRIHKRDVLSTSPGKRRRDDAFAIHSLGAIPSKSPSMASGRGRASRSVSRERETPTNMPAVQPYQKELFNKEWLQPGEKMVIFIPCIGASNDLPQLVETANHLAKQGHYVRMAVHSDMVPQVQSANYEVVPLKESLQSQGGGGLLSIFGSSKNKPKQSSARWYEELAGSLITAITKPMNVGGHAMNKFEPNAILANMRHTFFLDLAEKCQATLYLFDFLHAASTESEFYKDGMVRGEVDGKKDHGQLVTIFRQVERDFRRQCGLSPLRVHNRVARDSFFSSSPAEAASKRSSSKPPMSPASSMALSPFAKAQAKVRAGNRSMRSAASSNKQIVPPPRHYSFNFGGSSIQPSQSSEACNSDLDLSPESAYSPPDFTPMDPDRPFQLDLDEEMKEASPLEKKKKTTDKAGSASFNDPKFGPAL